MNERIKALIDQAGFIRYSKDENPLTPIDWSCDYSHELDKFAELIINESALFLNGAVEIYTQEEQDVCDHAAKSLKRYFGVK